MSQQYDIAITDQASGRILVFDAMETDWNREEAVKWSWRPSASNGAGHLAHAWGLPSGVKLRSSKLYGGQWMVVTDSRGLAAIVPYPAGGPIKWGLSISGNLHAAELLPDGNLAVAASTGGFVRVYTSSQGPSSADYAEYALAGAHGVLWDPREKVLWALGDFYLAALKVGGTDREPTLTELFKKALPSAYGHDLQPVYGDLDRLWISTNAGVYQYVKSSGEWDSAYEGAREISRTHVKAVGNQLTGQVVTSRPKSGCRYEWCTDTVNLYLPEESITRTGSAIYKARIFNPYYQ